MKMNEFEVAEQQSVLYSISGADETFQCETWPVFLGMPRTPEPAQLQVHATGNNTMWNIGITEYQKPSKKTLLCTLCCALPRSSPY